ncbi:hypothetical protein [Chitinophaga sp. LS1]|uniref:hypothetical protein n=1 Tax=Chitinophaga sp. LS1 TaxID=3051176 RepID=UPI002AAB86EF|nr:hypothetical protein [Chitinophaga sp. LS1]WPV65931.1 hypothetical protein QQL36_29455 [Chitinophaga sp. LS1]
MKAVITEVLLEAAQKYPTSFGTYDAHAVLQAIDNIEPSGCKEKDCIKQFYCTEQFAYVFELASDGSVNEQVLRLDLFRLIQPNKTHRGGFDFTGGLLHLFKHFRCDGYHLGTYPSSHNLSHPTDIIGIVIKCFFQSPHRQIEGEKYFTTLTKLDDQNELLCSFFPTGEINVYFLNTGYFPNEN